MRAPEIRKYVLFAPGPIFGPILVPFWGGHFEPQRLPEQAYRVLKKRTPKKGAQNAIAVKMNSFNRTSRTSGEGKRVG